MLTVDRFDLGDLALTSGASLPAAQLRYATAGRLNAARDNCVVLPTYYAGTHDSYACLIGPGRAIDTDRHFVVIPDMFGNGQSTSPSTVAWPTVEAPFPAISIADNVQAQARLVFGHLGVRGVALVGGWSMGAMQAFAWAAFHPDRVATLFAWCGTSRCWPLNAMFLDSLVAALRADPAYRRGSGSRPERGLRAFGAVYAGWAFSAEFFRTARYRDLGHDSAEALRRAWEDDHAAWHPDDLLTMLGTWRTAEADLLGHIRARTIIMPSSTDLYFTQAEAEIEAGRIAGAELRPLVSPCGHAAGAPGRFPRETGIIADTLAELLR